MLMSAEQSCLIVVDVQARLLPSMNARERMLRNTEILLRSAQRLNVPVLASEQYPRGLGNTVPEISALLPEDSTIEKMHFSCIADETFARRFNALGRPQVVVAGIEAHVCVLQTVLHLLQAGADTFVVADATSSRTECSHATALERMRAAGARVVTTEMVVFEWLARAGTPEFKELSALIR